MKLARLGARGSEVPAVVDGGMTHDLRPLTDDVDAAFLAGGGLQTVRAALGRGDLPELAGADAEFLVWHLSQYMALEPGDLALTGTPEGVALSGRFPFLRAGDVVELEIDGLGRRRHEMVAA